MNHRSALLLIVLLGLAHAAPADAAQEGASSAPTVFKGHTEAGVLVAVGQAMDIWGGLPDSEFLNVGVRLGRVFTQPIGPGPLSGNFVVSGEVYPVILFREKTGTTYAFSGALVFTHYFAPGWQVRPFISAGAGMVISARPIPRDISRVNFTPQGGGGIAVPVRSGALLSIEYRLHHMSDWILTPYNPGANSYEIQFGITWIH